MYFLAFAEEAEPQLTGGDQRAWLDRLEREIENLRSALAWSSATTADATLGLRLAAALSRFWWLRGYLSEGRALLLDRLAAAAGTDDFAARATALRGAGLLAWQQGGYPASRAL